MKLKELLKNIAEANDMTLKDAIVKADLNYNNILNKFQRDTLYYTDVVKILDALGKQITITDKELTVKGNSKKG